MAPCSGADPHDQRDTDETDVTKDECGLEDLPPFFWQAEEFRQQCKNDDQRYVHGC